MAVNYGLPAWLATLISATNLTSAGQFAGINMMAVAAGYSSGDGRIYNQFPLYAMSLSISQHLTKIRHGKKNDYERFRHRRNIRHSFHTKKNLNFKYFLGLATTLISAGFIGTLFGCAGQQPFNPLPAKTLWALPCTVCLSSIITPPAMRSKSIAFCKFLAVGFRVCCTLFRG